MREIARPARFREGTGSTMAESIKITEEMVYAGTKAILNELDRECGYGLPLLKAETAAREVLRCALEVWRHSEIRGAS